MATRDDTESALSLTSPAWRPRSQADLAPPGEKAKARANLDALGVLRRLQATDAEASADDCIILARWAGWGAVPDIFDDSREKWAAERTELRGLLSPEEWAAARRTVLNAHYTSAEVVSAVWAAVVGLGFTGGRVLEPGCGSGNFIGLAPALPLELVGIELDPITAAVAAMLYPGADIRAQGFEDTTFAPDHFDLVVGNVPFAKLPVHDPVYNKARHSIHNYFILKALEFLRPGGLMAVLTSRYTLDARNSAARREMAERADLIGAVRLPEGAFHAAAGTQATIDVLLLRKRSNGANLFATPWSSLVSVPTTGRSESVEINEYFAAHPDHMLGRLVSGRGMYVDAEPVLKPEGELAPALAAALADIVAQGLSADLAWVPESRPTLKVTAPRTRQRAKVSPGPLATLNGASQAPGTVVIPAPPRKEGTILADGAGFGIVRHGVIEPYAPTPKSDTVELRHLVQLRDIVAALLEAQATSADDTKFLAYQSALNNAYDAYVAKFGTINRFKLARTGRKDAAGEDKTRRMRPRMGGFRAQDPDFPSLLALEIFDPESQTAEKAPIFSTRVVSPRVHRREAATAQDALSICLDEHGDVRIDVIAKLLSVDTDTARSMLAELVWENPNTGVLETEARYLSGNVRAKLAEARLAALADPRFEPHVAALEAVIPADLGPTEIDARLGCTWIDSSYIERFIKEVLMDLQPDTDGWKYATVEVGHVPLTATWSVYTPAWARQTVSMTSTWGTGRSDAAHLVEFSLNQSPAVVYDTIMEDGKRKQVKNLPETLSALEKQEVIDERFAEWVWEDNDRATALVRIYNDRFNSTVTPVYDGSHLTLPGLATNITPHPHQLNSIWRTICEPTVGLFHPVGAGKAQPMDAPILTPGGFRRMGDLMVGDEVIAGDGTVTTVTGVFPQGPRLTHTVEFSDGATAQCDIEHLWEVTTSQHRADGVTPKVLTLRELQDDLTTRQGHPKWEVPVAPAADFDRGLYRPLDPYLLGLILGDGTVTQATVGFCSADPELVNAVADHLPADYHLVSTGDPARPYDYRVRPRAGRCTRGNNTFIESLYELGVMRMNARHKSVPLAYKEAPVAVRLAVLQGLLDTDGTLDRRTGNGVSLISASRQLAEDVAWLTRSLGGVAKTSEVTKSGRQYHHVSVALPAGFAPFRLSRKANLYVGRSKYPLRRAIVRIEPGVMKPMQCISVAHERQLYVTENFVVTHNTLVMVSAAMEMRRLGLINKPMITVPNHMLEQFAAEMIQHFPRARVLLATKDQTDAAHRKEFVARCAMGEWDAIVITHSAFERIPVSPGTKAVFLSEKMDELRQAIETQKAEEGARVSIKRMENALARLEERHERLLADHKKDDGINFESSGVDWLAVDEAHLHKNMAFPTRIRSAGGEGSQRAEDLEVKLIYLRSRYGDRVCALSTATPVANSLAEVFVMQRYLQPEALRAAQIYEFDAWAATFGKTINQLELSPDGSSYRIGTRFARFRNVPDLMGMFRMVADVRTPDELDLPIPAIASGAPEALVVPPTEALTEFMTVLADRAEEVRGRAVTPEIDNMLSVSNDGRKAALHMRLVLDARIRPEYAEQMESILELVREATAADKVEVAAREIAAEYHRRKDDRFMDPAGHVSPRPGACQLVFCDLGTPKDGRWSVYEELRDHLHRLGLPVGSVRFIHEATDDRAKAEMFAACRDGRIAVLVASTAKGGVGTNIQARLVALHHLDCPWRPCDIEQREGRILRQGNQNATVRILRYVTEKSFDTYLWQTVARKAAFIYQVMSGKFKGREVDDIGEQALSFAEVKALATGNPLLMEQAGVDQEVARLVRSARAYHQDQWRLQNVVDNTARSIEMLEREVALCEGAIARRIETRGDRFAMTVAGHTYTKRNEAGDDLIRRLEVGCVRATEAGHNETIGTFAGFDVTARWKRVREYGSYYGATTVEVTVRLKGTPIYFIVNRNEIANLDPQGTVIRLEHRVHDLDRDRDRAAVAIDQAANEKERASERIGMDFPHAEELAKLQARAAEIRAILEAEALRQEQARNNKDRGDAAA